MENKKSYFLTTKNIHKRIPTLHILTSEDHVECITSSEIFLKYFMNNYKILSPFYYDTPLSNHIATELIEYLSGDRDVFTLPFTIRGTPFQQNVYQTLQAQVTYGQTISYKNLALLAGYPKAARAVGTAMKINPLPFIIPCHRVIRSNGNPGEYAMGASIKYFLLSLEKNFIPNSLH